MDAQAMAFPDASFDCVVGQFVITLVEDPERVLSECARVLKPGGQIILVNHLYSEKGLAAAVERLLAQKARKLGLRPEFPFQRLAPGRSPWRRRADRAAEGEAVPSPWFASGGRARQNRGGSVREECRKRAVINPQ